MVRRKQPQPLMIDDKEFNRILKRLETTDKISAAREALEKAGKSVMKASIKRTPVAEGDLRDSHRLSISVDGDKVHANIDVEDEAAWYTHEQLENRHDDGEAKFLQKAIKSRRGFFQKQIRVAFSNLIRKRGLAE